jgi:annexin D
MMLWTADPAARDAKLAHKAMKKKGERYVWVLIEVACASTPDHLVAVRKAYRESYPASLEEDVAACPLYKDPRVKQARPPPAPACRLSSCAVQCSAGKS